MTARHGPRRAPDRPGLAGESVPDRVGAAAIGAERVLPGAAAGGERGRGVSAASGTTDGKAPDRDVPDLRLAGLAVAAWLAALAGLHLSVRSTVWVAAVAAALALLTGLHLGGVLGRPSATARRYGWIAVAVLLGVLCGAAATGARVAVRDAAPIRALVTDRAPVTAELVLRDDPRPVRGAPGRQPMLLVRVDLIRLAGPGGARVTGPVRALVLATDPAWRPLLPGQRVTSRGRLAAPRGGDLTAAVLSTADPPTLRGDASWPQRAAGVLRAGLQRACEPLPDAPGGLLPGLVVGDTSRLLPEVEEDFRATGMTHVMPRSRHDLRCHLRANLVRRDR